jgi:hypothetical protein
MNLEEVKKDLLAKVKNGFNGRYFHQPLFKSDTECYIRRSFDDLFKYYKQRNVTERMLLQALVESKFKATVCGAINKVIFFRTEGPNITILWKDEFIQGHTSTTYFNYGRSTKNTKYTAEYMDNLLESLKLNN